MTYCKIPKNSIVKFCEVDFDVCGPSEYFYGKYIGYENGKHAYEYKGIVKYFVEVTGEEYDKNAIRFTNKIYDRKVEHCEIVLKTKCENGAAIKLTFRKKNSKIIPMISSYSEGAYTEIDLNKVFLELIRIDILENFE